MKNKILAFLTALVVGFAGFSVSAPVVAWAVTSEFEFLSAFWDFALSVSNYADEIAENKAAYASTPEGIKARAIVLEKFKPYKKELPSDLSKSDFLQLLVDITTDNDYSYLEETYGKEVADFHLEHCGDLIDFKANLIFPLFNGLDDFVDALFDSDLDNYNIDDDGNPQIPADDFKKEINDQSKTITPKNRKYQKYSWRDLSEEYYESSQVNFGSGNFARYIPMETITIENACGIEGNTKQYKGFYLQSYMERKGSSYFQPYQYLFYCEEHEYEGASPDSNVSSPVWYTHYNWYCRPIFYETLDGVSIDTFDVLAAGLDSKYIPSTDPASGERVFLPVYPNYCSLGFNSNGQISLSFGDDLGSIRLNYPIYWQFALNNNFMQACSPFYNSNYAYFLRYDNVLDKIPLIYGTVRDVNTGANVVRSGLRHFFLKGSDSMGISTYPIRYHDSGDPNGRMTDIVTCDEDHTCDFGFYVSNEQFTTTYKIDTSRIPSNAVVTIKGGDVYTWNITDETTGDTITIGELIDSDYVIPPSTPGNTSGGGNGGGNGGNVNVGGDVKVDGTVTVSGGVDINVSVPDINVNVNVSGGVGVGGNGGGVNASLPDMSPVDEYLESAADDSSGFRRFLADFFSFLPNDIILLLGIAISVAIVCRLLGR